MAAQDCQKSRLLVMLTNTDKKISIVALCGFLELTKNVIRSSLHTFPENFMQIGPAIFL